MSLQDSLNSYIKGGSIGGFKKPDEEKSGSDPFTEYIKTGKVPEAKKIIEKQPEKKQEPKYSEEGANLLTLNNNYGVSASTPTTTEKSSVVSVGLEKTGAATAVVAKKTIKAGLDAFNKLQQWRDEQTLKSPLNQVTTIENGQIVNRPKYQTAEEMRADAPIMKMLNSKAGMKAITEVADKTSNVPLKTMAWFKSWGEQTYDEAYSAYLKERNNPENGKFKQFLYELQDSGPQSALGVLLSLGTAYATRRPEAGYAISSAYYTALSADEQIKEKGKVGSLGNIAIDVVGDQVLGAGLQGLFKDTASKSILRTAGRSFVTEGGTEVSQSLLKYANDYGKAKTEEEKKSIIEEAKRYIVDGGMAMEFLVGGVSGAIIGSVADYAAQKSNPSLQPKKEAKGQAPAGKGPDGGDEGKSAIEMQKELEQKTYNRDFSKMRDELSNLQEKSASGEVLTGEEINRAAVLSDELADFQTVNRDKAVTIRDNEGEKIVDIDTVEYEDGKVGFAVDVAINDQNLNVPINSAEVYPSKKEAVKAAGDFVEQWTKENASEEIAQEVKKQIDEQSIPFSDPKKLLNKDALNNKETLDQVAEIFDKAENKSEDDFISFNTMEGPQRMTMGEARERLDDLANSTAFEGEDGANEAAMAEDEIRAIKNALEKYDSTEGGKPKIKVAKKNIDNASESTYNKDQQYDKKSDNSGRGDRPDKLSEPVQKSAKKQAGSGGGGAERGKGVARGKGGERATSAGERLGSRIIQTNEDRKKLAEEVTNITQAGLLTITADHRNLSEEEKLALAEYETAGGREKKGAEGARLLDEYYTNPEIVNITWKALEGLIPAKPYVLEPSAGIGNFIAGAPDESLVQAYEVNETTARIAKVLYPDANIWNRPFESQFISDRGVKVEQEAYYDLVIGNPPYGDHRGKFKGLGEEPGISRYEEYFIKRSLDLTKPGGYVAFVIPSGFLRGAKSKSKKIISELGSLEKAYRLPNNAFETTDIGTDIVIFRRYKSKPLDSLVRNAITMISDDYYFSLQQNQKNILGTEFEVKGRFGMEVQTMGSLGEAVDKFNKQFPAKEEKTDAVEEKDEISKPEVEKKLAPETAKEDKPEPATKKPVTKTAQKNQKALIETPKETKGTTKLSEKTSQDNMEVWENTTATGELTAEYTRNILNGKNLKQFYNENVNVVMENGVSLFNDFNYYQGDIYAKLEKLEADKAELLDEQYKKQKLGLEMAMPPKHTADRMMISPNTTFATETKITYNGEERSLSSAFESWLDELPHGVFSGSSRYEIIGYIRGESVRGSDKVRNNMIRVRRREVGDKLFRLFLKEGLSLQEQAEVEQKYNRAFNSYARPDYSKVPLVGEIHKDFRGKPIEVKPVQKEGVGFLTNKGIGLLAHDVGVGKTMQAILSVNEVMQRGWAKKPLIVTPPGNVYAQWKSEIQEIIPGVKIVDLDNLGARFKGDLSTLEIPEGAISTISYEGFKRLGFKQETYNRLTADLNDVMAMPGDMTKRAAEKAKEKAGELVGKGIKGTTDQVFFEDLGFDHITFDEVHNANHIIKGAKLDGNKATEFRGLTINPSELGIKTWLATQYILKNNDNRNVFLLSATPFTNHPLEYYSILSLMARERLNRMGLKNVNDFMNMFMELTYDYEYRADGSYKEKNEIKSFKNYQQFQKLLTEFIDFRDGEEAGVKRPNRIGKEYQISPTQDQYDYMESAQEFFSPKYRDEGGTLIAIGEMRKIAFSPYLSRFYKGEIPDYKTFVNSSPKIKMTMELIKQNKKDNPEAGQIIYSPIGVEYFPHIREYLIKVIGYKPGEVEIIAGSVAFNKKLAIQEKFNNGEIKVIIGSDSIKEGVNLQKNTTDMFLLSMPWNFTQLRQVIGRAWRQGNNWKNIRINNIFTENSIDIFLSQKLSNKEKRYENSLAFKGDNLDVGDINFEELKFDLATNPVIKAQIEYAYKKKQLEKQIGEIKADAAFFGRRLEKVQALEDEVARYKETAKNRPDDEWYKGAVERKQKELDAEKGALKERGLDVETMAADLQKKKAPVKALEGQLQDLQKEYDQKLKEAQETKEQAIVRENNYQAPIADRKAENKNFYQRVDKPVTASPGASVGQYADGTEVMLGSLDNIRPMHLPDMVQMINDIKGITGANTRIKSEARIKANKIEYRPEIFEDTVQAEKILSHEIGHLIDMNPEGAIDRGNILGRLFALRRFLKNRFGDTEVTNKELRDELWEASKAWRPLPEVYTKGYEKYRKSSRELYADAISILFNNPGLLEQKAPKFYKEFFMSLEKKPDVKKAYFSLQQELRNGMPVQKYRERLQSSFRKADYKAVELEMIERDRDSISIKDWWFNFKREFMTIHTPFENMAKEQRKAGSLGNILTDDDNPLHYLNERNYLGGKIKAMVEENYLPIIERLKENGISQAQLGELMMYERIAEGDRGKIANPMGLAKEYVEEMLGENVKDASVEDAKKNGQSLREELGEERYQIAKNLATEARTALKKLFGQGYEEGLYSDELMELVESNDKYVPFRVQKYMGARTSFAVRKQVGTLNEIENPFNSLIDKSIAILRAIERNKVKREAINFVRQYYPDEVEQAQSRFVNDHKEIIRIEDYQTNDKKHKYYGKKTVSFMQNGKPVGFVVDQYIANSIDNTTIAMNKGVVKILSALNAGWLRPVYITVNLGFQSFNAIRDYFRYIKNMPDTGIIKATVDYAKALKGAVAKGFDLENDLVKEMYASGAASITMGDLFSGASDEDTQLDLIMSKAGIGERDFSQRSKFVRPLVAVLDFIKNLGDTVESLPKVAAYMRFKKANDGGQLTMAQKDYLRRYIGSPDFLMRGEWTANTNNIFLFSNAIVQGIRADIQIAKDPTTRSGFWWKTAQIAILPKILMFAAAAGLFGDWLEDLFGKATEYDKANYIIVPMGIDENGKAIYFRVPMDETSRFITAFVWKMMNFKDVVTGEQTIGKAVGDIVSLWGGQLPAVTAAITIPVDTFKFASGQNIYDEFRQRNVISDKEMEAGGWYKAKPFLKYIVNQAGGNIFIRLDYGDKFDQTPLEKVMRVPILSNIIGRFVKVTDYGEAEKMKSSLSKIKQGSAAQSIEQGEIITQRAQDFRKSDKNNSIFERNKAERDLIEELLGHPPKNADEKADAANIKKRFRLAVKKTVKDPLVNALIYANNDQKLELLKDFKENSTPEEYSEALKSLLKEQIISETVYYKIK